MRSSAGLEFIYLRHRAGFDRASVAEYLGLSLRTVRRYEQLGAPHVVFLALASRAGELPGWEGYWFRDGHVITPLGDKVWQSEIANRDYLYYLYWMRGWEAGHALSAAEKPPRRLRLIKPEAAPCPRKAS